MNWYRINGLPDWYAMNENGTRVISLPRKIWFGKSDRVTKLKELKFRLNRFWFNIDGTNYRFTPEELVAKRGEQIEVNE